MTMNKQKVQLREKTALLDKMTLNNVRILGFTDKDALIKQSVVEMTTSQVRYITADDQDFNRLTIKNDGVINHMIAGSRLIGSKRVDYCSIDVTINDPEYNNLVCYTVAEYEQRLLNIQEYLQERYGIIADFSDVTIKEIEINRTFKLDEDFRKYHRPLQLIMSNLPQRLKNQNDWKEYTEYQTYSASSKSTNKSKRYLMFKIYNKSKAIERTIVLTDSYMRVEFKLVGTEKIKRSLSTNILTELTDQLINDYFDEQINKLIIKPFEKWQKDRNKYLVKLMKDERARDIRHWQTNVLRLLQNEEIAEKQPTLLDIEELVSLVDQLNLKSKRRYDVRKNFRTQSEKYETVFCNKDDLKMQEIITKLTVKEDTVISKKDTVINPNIDGISKIA